MTESTIERGEKLKRWRMLHFPAYLILGMHSGYSGPIPIFTKTDGKTACHLEISKDDAMRTARELGELRVKHRDSYPEIHGSAFISVNSLNELMKFVNSMIPVPDGYLTEFHYDPQTDTANWIYMDFAKLRSIPLGQVQ